ncbi:MAG: alpha/beta fold hydrolase [Candidatus Rokuibacteriota bacterium]
MPHVPLDGVRLFYQETGAPEAPPLLLIMGWGGGVCLGFFRKHRGA